MRNWYRVKRDFRGLTMKKEVSNEERGFIWI